MPRGGGRRGSGIWRARASREAAAAPRGCFWRWWAGTKVPRWVLCGGWGRAPQSLKYLVLLLWQAEGLPPVLLATPEQQFLAVHYESNAKSSDRDPRQTFRTPADPAGGGGAGVVGPLGSSSFSLPTVERALFEMEGGGHAGEREGRRAGA